MRIWSIEGGAELHDRGRDLVVADARLCVFAVMDGVGEDTPREAVEQARNAMQAVLDDSAPRSPSLDTGSARFADADELLATLVGAADRSLRDYSKLHGCSAASTVAIAALSGGRLHWYSLGDSRIYLRRGDGSLERLTEDDTRARELARKGIVGEEELPESLRQGCAITRALGIRKEAAQENRGSLHAREGDLVFLCTDGVWRAAGEEALAKELSTLAEGGGEGLDPLEEAVRSDGSDDYAAVAVLLEEGDLAHTPEEIRRSAGTVIRTLPPDSIHGTPGGKAPRRRSFMREAGILAAVILAGAAMPYVLRLLGETAYRLPGWWWSAALVLAYLILRFSRR